jgi:DNA integrity scanning protein DisA with diadenylate cyclase activity
MSSPTDLEAELIRAAMGIASRRHIARLLYVSDMPLPPQLVRPSVRKKVVTVVSSQSQRDLLEEAGERVVLVPGYEMGRQDKFKLALIGAATRDLVEAGDNVVGLIGRRPRSFPDTLWINKIERSALEATTLGQIGPGNVAPEVFDAIIDLAVRLGVEGWEGHAVGCMFVAGDSQRIMEGSLQLGLNPFQGYSESQRAMADPAVRDALRNFATLDGAFVVRQDGVVLAAGRYLQFEAIAGVEAPPGTGARHMAAALATANTEATAVTVSQSNGKVRVFRGGKVVLDLTPSHRRT